VSKEPSDPRLKTNSQLLYHVKKALNLQGMRKWIKKPMWRDGHLTDEHQYYLITRVGDIAIYDPDYRIRNLLTEYNKEGTITLAVVR
jgi:hypothetical protein